MTAFDPTPRTTVRRRRDRACYDRDLVFGILDEGFICHAACTVDGTVWMIPTIYGRDGDRLLLHGAAANHVLKAAANGAELTVTVTLVDGLVLARSTFHHSINYRSVVIFGHATGIEDVDEKAAPLGRGRAPPAGAHRRRPATEPDGTGEQPGGVLAPRRGVGQGAHGRPDR